MERLIEIYVEYYKDVTPMEASQHKHLMEREMPQTAPRTGQTTIKETVERTATNRKEQPHGKGMSKEARLKQGMDGNTSISTSSGCHFIHIYIPLKYIYLSIFCITSVYIAPLGVI